MSPQRLLCSLLLCLVSLSLLSAQDETLLRLDAPVTALQTGQETVVTITGQNVDGLWVGDMVIRYDPYAVYIMGTTSGSPITPGSELSAQAFTVVRNAVHSPDLQYTFSLINPAKPLSGTYTLGTFRIYPLKAGPTEIQFFSAALSSFTPPPAGQPVEQDDIGEMRFLPVMLQLQITGDTVPIPSEATATLSPTETPLPTDAPFDPNLPTQESLVNVTAAPLPTTPAANAEAAAPSPLLLVGLGMVVIAVIGLGLLFANSRRK